MARYTMTSGWSARPRCRPPRRGWATTAVFSASLILDEFRLYRRALSAAEVQAAFHGRALPEVAEAEIQIEPHWYEDNLLVRLSSRNRHPTNGSMRVRLTFKDGETKTRTVGLQASEATGTARTTGEAAFELADFIGRSTRLAIDLHDAKESKLDTLTRKFMLEKPAWVYNQVGIPEGVPAPWTPVRVEKTASGLNVDVWGRRYTVGSTPFFSQINSQEADFLAEPMRVHATVNGAVVEFAHQGLEVTETTPEAVVFKQRFTSESGLGLSIACRLEYDGFARFRMDIQSDRAIRVQQLFFEMPVKKEHALFAHGLEVYPLDPQTENYVKSSHRGFTGNEDLSWKFTCNAYLGDDDRFPGVAG